MERGEAPGARAAARLLRQLTEARECARHQVSRAPVDQHGRLSLSHRAGGEDRGGDCARGIESSDVGGSRAVRVLQRGGSGGLSSDFGGAGSRERYLRRDRKSTRLNSSHLVISYAVFCLKKNLRHVLVGLQDPVVSRHEIEE